MARPSAEAPASPKINYSRPLRLRPPLPDIPLTRQEAVASPTCSSDSSAEAGQTEMIDLGDFLEWQDEEFWRPDEIRHRPTFPLVVDVAQAPRPTSPTPSRRESRSSILFDNPRLSFSAPSSPSSSPTTTATGTPRRPPRSEARAAPRSLQGLFANDHDIFTLQEVAGHAQEKRATVHQIKKRRRRSVAEVESRSAEPRVQFEVMGIAL